MTLIIKEIRISVVSLEINGIVCVCVYHYLCDSYSLFFSLSLFFFFSLYMSIHICIYLYLKEIIYNHVINASFS
jgi:hypothetical protein